MYTTKDYIVFDTTKQINVNKVIPKQKDYFYLGVKNLLSFNTNNAKSRFNHLI